MKFGQKTRHRDNDDKEVCCFQYLYSQYVLNCMMGYQVMGLPLLIVHVHNQRNIYKVVRSHVFTKISYYKHTDGFILDNLGLLRVNYS